VWTVVNGQFSWSAAQVGHAWAETEISGGGGQIGLAMPVSPNLTDIAPVSDQAALRGSLSDGTIEQIAPLEGRRVAAFCTGRAASVLAPSPPAGETVSVPRSDLAAQNAAAVFPVAQSVTTENPVSAHSADLTFPSDDDG
jgi:hypothetical protein